MMKNILRKVYRSMPFKKVWIKVLRWSRIFELLPLRLSRLVFEHLVFEGPFSVKVQSSSFQIVNGYGREIESLLFWGGVDNFERETLRLWQTLSKRSTYIFDIGANTGVFLLVSKALNPNAYVYGFEPIQRVFSILENNVKLNQFPSPPVGVFRIALSDYSGTGQMYDLPLEHIYTACLNRNVHQERGQLLQAISEPVPVIRLDDFVLQNGIPRIDLVKIDVESHEPSVLRGIGNYLSQFLPTMIVEIWNNEVGGQVEAIISDYPYLYFAIQEDGPERTSHIRNDLPEKGCLNYLICTEQVAIELCLG